MRNLILLLSLLLASCSMQLYKIDVQQGNAITPEMVSKLKLGMTRAQVRFILGTPLVADPFHINRWDYVYSYRKSGKLTERHTLSVIFDHDVVRSVEGDDLPPGGITESVPAAQKVVEPTPVAEPAQPVEPASVQEKAVETPPPAEPAQGDVNLLLAPELGAKPQANGKNAQRGTSPAANSQ
jgi:outer membrane protein assembly factor BamE